MDKHGVGSPLIKFVQLVAPLSTRSSVAAPAKQLVIDGSFARVVYRFKTRSSSSCHLLTSATVNGANWKHVDIPAWTSSVPTSAVVGRTVRESTYRVDEGCPDAGLSVGAVAAFNIEEGED